MYIAYMMMFMIISGMTVMSSNSNVLADKTHGTSTSVAHKQVESVLTQMHYYHMAAYEIFDTCIRLGTCPNGEIDPTTSMPDIFSDAQAFDSERFISFIMPTGDVSNSDIDGVLVTVWADGAERDHYLKGVAYTKARGSSNSYYVGGRANRLSGNNYHIDMLEANEFRTGERVTNAIFSIGSTRLSDLSEMPNDMLAFFSAGSHVDAKPPSDEMREILNDRQGDTSGSGAGDYTENGDDWKYM